jgi:hypothetical protein
MHGNESTTTKALFDFWLYLKTDEAEAILEHCTFLMIPQLSPDGSHAYTRLNANDVDLNRDAIEQSQPESKILHRVYNDFKPDYCFNLHGQRTIFAAGNSNIPATVSFLAPSADSERSLTPAREIAMKLIVAANEKLQRSIPGAVGRYDDGFNINCVGDYFTSQNTPTILFEAGHFPGDYNRVNTRKHIFDSIVTMSKTIADGSINSFSVKSYFDMPENSNHLRDIELYNLKQTIGGIASVEHKLFVQFREEKNEDNIQFIPEFASHEPNLHGIQRINVQEHNKLKNLLFNPNTEIDNDLTKTISLLDFQQFI